MAIFQLKACTPLGFFL